MVAYVDITLCGIWSLNDFPHLITESKFLVFCRFGTYNINERQTETSSWWRDHCFRSHHYRTKVSTDVCLRIARMFSGKYQLGSPCTQKMSIPTTLDMLDSSFDLISPPLIFADNARGSQAAIEVIDRTIDYLAAGYSISPNPKLLSRT